MRISLIVTLAALLSACAGPAPVPAATQLTVDDLQAGAGRLAFSGSTSLPDQTCLLTQVLIEGAVAPDWPVDCVFPVNGRWRLEVAVGLRGQPPQPRSGADWAFVIWTRDLPGLAARRSGPPGPAIPR